MTKVCHLTTVHNRYDTRIFVKECRSLAKAGYEVHLVVADGLGDETKDEVRFWDLGKPGSRKERVLSFGRKILEKALEIDAAIYHLHDPELLGIAGKLRRKGKKVVFDAHEDVPRQLLTKAYLPGWVRPVLSRAFEAYEDRVVSRLSGVITATPHIRDRFLKRQNHVTEVQNFPFLEEFTDRPEVEQKERAVCYVGAISKVRGILQIIHALSFTDDATLLLGGKFESEALRDQAVATPGWEQVDELGFLSRDEVAEVLAKSAAGLVVLEPTISYLDSIPVKMFEYMASGIPVIASDFPYWRALLQGVDCAVFVDPNDPEAIAGAIDQLVANPEKAKTMGAIGKQAVFDKFNWNNEETKLLAFYDQILSG